MTEKKDETYKRYLSYLKDAFYIIGLCIALIGWVSSNSKNRAILETTVKYNTKMLEKVELFMEKQTELNGKFIQYMEK